MTEEMAPSQNNIQENHCKLIRSQYDSLVEKHIEGPKKQIMENELDPQISNPLSTDSKVSNLYKIDPV